MLAVSSDYLEVDSHSNHRFNGWNILLQVVDDIQQLHVDLRLMRVSVVLKFSGILYY